MKRYLVLVLVVFSMHQVKARSFDWYVKQVSDPKSLEWVVDYGEDIGNLAISELILTEKLNWDYSRLIKETINNKIQSSRGLALIFPRDVGGKPYPVVVDLNGTKRQLLESLADKVGISPDQLKVMYGSETVILNSDEPLSTLNKSVQEITTFKLVKPRMAAADAPKQLVDNQIDAAIALEMMKIHAILKDMGNTVEEDVLRQPAATRVARAAKWIAELERTKALVGHIAGGGGFFTEDF